MKNKILSLLVVLMIMMVSTSSALVVDNGIEVIQPDTHYFTTSDDVLVCVTVDLGEAGVDNVVLHLESEEMQVPPGSNFFMNYDSELDAYCQEVSATTMDAEDGLRVTYSVTAKDDSGNTVTEESEDFWWVYDGEDPTADVGGDEGVYSCNEGDSKVLLGSGYDEATLVEDLVFEWDWNYNGESFQVDDEGASTEVECVDGTDSFQVALRVTDGVGNSDLSEGEVEV